MFDAEPTRIPIPLPQSREFARALRTMGSQVSLMPLGEEGALGRVMMQRRKLPVVGQVGLVSRGPVWRGPADPKVLAAHLAEVKHPVILNADAPADADLLRAGFFPLLSPATLAVLPLSGSVEDRWGRMHQKWRNRLRRGQDAPLRIRRTALTGGVDHWLLQAEAVQRRKKAYRGLPLAFAVAYAVANPAKAQVFEAMLKGSPVAGMLFLRHEGMATYHIGHTSAAGRAMHAHCALLAHAADWLADHGADSLDLGTIDTVHAPGLARFKLGSGAQPRMLGGTWLHQRWLAPTVRLCAR